VELRSQNTDEARTYDMRSYKRCVVPVVYDMADVFRAEGHIA
jgi:hypothetical protein